MIFRQPPTLEAHVHVRPFRNPKVAELRPS